MLVFSGYYWLWLFVEVASVSAFSAVGMVTTALLIKVTILLPAAILGFYIGIKVLPKINATLFRKIAASIISIAALAIIVTFLLELIQREHKPVGVATYA